MYLGDKIYGNFKPDRKRYNSQKHLRLIRQLPSCISGLSGPCDPHHLLSIKGERGQRLRATDRWTVPLTREEHRLLHHQVPCYFTEEDWFIKRGIMPHALARALWNATGDLVRMSEIVEEHWAKK